MITTTAAISAIAIRRVRSAAILAMSAVWWERTGGSISNCYSTGAVSGFICRRSGGTRTGISMQQYQQLLFDRYGQRF